MKKKHICILGIGIIIFLMVLAGTITISSNNKNDNDKSEDVPDEVSEVLDNYFSALKKGAEEAVEYIHFENDDIKEAYLASGCYLIDYNIEEIEKVNDHLYAITVQTKTNTSVLHHGDEFEIVYNFVGNIDGKWYFMNGISHIPASIRDNLDPNKYTYDDDRIVNKEDVIMP